MFICRLILLWILCDIKCSLPVRPLLKKSLGNSYLKILDFSQLLVADTPMILFFSIFFVYTLWQHFWDTQYKNIFAFIKKIFSQP